MGAQAPLLPTPLLAPSLYPPLDLITSVGSLILALCLLLAIVLEQILNAQVFHEQLTNGVNPYSWLSSYRIICIYIPHHVPMR